mmetsp:Transcript_21195/g.25517  ORF Transcript_21195/g.25517 Transcript_21195/m.25517 type:complete len:184 (-) Transcript_21195:2581-3132(-)
MATTIDGEEAAHICFRSEESLRRFPGGALPKEAVLDYFSESPFYDRACRNEQARRQALLLSRLPIQPGIPEYVLHTKGVEPHLYIILKQQREDHDTVKRLAIYYVLDGTIYQAPTLHAALSARMARCLFSVGAAFDRFSTGLQIRADKHRSEKTVTASTVATKLQPNTRTVQEIEQVRSTQNS